ncbi:hypothetical protein ACFY0F_33725 [Streptomyces sp. NPDC001544]|uniref:hypothetical protein n=1 Tax=Streptomyces sp. NPDC001544 TaxID=3364584 RepID=UPI0036D0611F
MRPLSVPVRLAATAMVLAAASGCVSVGDDADPGRPAHSAGQRDGRAPDGLAVVSGHGGGYDGGPADGKHRHGGKARPGKSASASAEPSAPGSASPTAPAKPGRTAGPGEPAPTDAQPVPSRTAEPTPTPPPPPPPPPPTPTSAPPSAEPSSSAHEETGPQLVEREPAPEAGSPV